MLSLSDSRSVGSSVGAERSGRIDSGGPRRRPTQLHLLELPQIPRASLSPNPALTPFLIGTCRVSWRVGRLLLGGGLEEELVWVVEEPALCRLMHGWFRGRGGDLCPLPAHGMPPCCRLGAVIAASLGIEQRSVTYPLLDMLEGPYYPEV